MLDQANPIPDYVTAMIRAAMMGVGGYFVNHGLATQDQMVTVTSAVLVAVGVVWSLYAKYAASKKLQAAIDAPAGKAS